MYTTVVVQFGDSWWDHFLGWLSYIQSKVVGFQDLYINRRWAAGKETLNNFTIFGLANPDNELPSAGERKVACGRVLERTCI